MINLKYSEIIKENRKLENSTKSKYNISILSNIMVHQSKDICEYLLRTSTINANVLLGEYDNIVQDSIIHKKSNAVVIFWEISNLIDGFQYKIELFNDNEYMNILNKVKLEIDLVLDNLKSVPLLVINKFSSLIFSKYNLTEEKIDIITNELNDYILNKNNRNLKLIDIDKIISNISINKAVSLRNFYSSKTLYSIEFYKKYFEFIKPYFLSSNGNIKKVLVFDCDNTLWRGVLGEEGFNNITMFTEVQYIAKQLAKKGVIIGLCSKNNFNDIEEVLTLHKKMILRNDDIVIKKINWIDKVTNLKEIAKELNLGLDSLVFIDDSDFEINLIKEKLPMVATLQVPKNEYDYNIKIREVKNLFYQASETKEDFLKVKMYKEQVERVKDEKKLVNIESYLRSLGLVITIYENDLMNIARFSQMTQKTNQFNLTTKRYSEQEIIEFINNKNKMILAISVKDKYGDNGIVGLAILELDGEYLTIDTLLMSCRVLGRNIEYKFIDLIVYFARKNRIKTIRSKYLRTQKNEQVSDLYENCGFDIIYNSKEEKLYELDIHKYKKKDLDYIGIKNGK